MKRSAAGRRQESLSAVASITEAFGLYQQYIRDFHKAGGPVRPLFTLEQFTEWWLALSEQEQDETFRRYEAGYEDTSASARGSAAMIIRQHILPQN